ncbi:MAG: TlpA disulfide reductase family protein [Acidobacteriota bacterium]|nr:TlpA family protein disulfide reductase [Blastocatellia bacterium]MDW8241153.1 TlpA disulfide reductase family protein [Acidobacteriota bacterium]
MNKFVCRIICLWIGGVALGLWPIVSMASMSAVAQTSSASWKLPMLGGGQTSLAELRGSVVALSFGATWCPPCRMELPALQALADKYQGKNVKVFWVSIDDRKVSDQQLADFAQKLGLKVPILRDVNQDVFSQFAQSSIPMLVVLDRQGNVVGKPHLGFSDKATYLENISALIDSVL